MLSRIVRPAALAAFAASASLLFALGCGGGGGGGPTSPPPSGGTGGNGGNTGGSTSADITVQNNQFSPTATTVAAGTTVTWTWNSCTGDGYGGQLCTDHSVVFDNGVRTGSGVQSSGSFASQFATAGTYGYHCSIHGTATSGMRGTITVQ
jgi:plastocyanin